MLALSTLFLPPGWPRRLPGWSRLAPRLAGGPRPTPSPRPAAVALWLLLFFVPQLLLPLRHWLYPGRVSWTEEGHLFAWHMKLRDKEGHVRFWKRRPRTAERHPIDHRPLLTSRQEKQMSGRPAMIVQFARHLRDEIARTEGELWEITADAYVSLNGRPPQLLIDPGVDLAALEPGWSPAWWIVPLYDAP
jgi:hypothetical protein